MYWYYKYPMLLLLVLLLGGVGYIVWQSRGPDEEERPLPDPQGEEQVADSGNPATPVPDTPVNDRRFADPTDDPGNDVEPSRPDDPPADPQPPVATTLPKVERLLTTARAQLEAGNLETGRELARRALHTEGVVEFDANWYDAAELITKANTAFMNSGAPCSEKVGYTIQPGDNLTTIAIRHNTTVNALKRLNPEMLGGATARIYPGKTLFILQADWSIRVSKEQFLLLLFNGPELFKIYHIAVGRENRTPVGTFEIYNKVVHPDWTHPSGEVIPYGDTANVLGTHWMAIRPTGETDPTLRGFGIHGTWDANSIGTNASLGCVRMRNAEVEELYDFIPMPRGGTGTKVTIE
jgi:lipoprotein-anchoring transpeptidase ErfK/SrfK